MKYFKYYHITDMNSYKLDSPTRLQRSKFVTVPIVFKMSQKGSEFFTPSVLSVCQSVLLLHTHTHTH